MNKKIKLGNGFTVTVDDQVFHKMRLLDAIADAKTDGSEFSNVVKMIVGAEQRDALYDYFEEKEGREILVEDLGAIIGEISEALGEEAKN